MSFLFFLTALVIQVIESQAYWDGCPNLKHLLEDIWCARQPSTVQLYCYSIRKFLAYCAIFDHNVSLPISSELAASFISFSRHNSGTRGAISSAINALKWLHNFVPGINSNNDPLNEKILKLVVDSALRHLPKNRRNKKPLEHEFIDRVLLDARKASCLVDVRDRLIISLSYTLLFRHDEIAHISCAHLSLVHGGLNIAIPSSKTDVYKNGGNALLSNGRVFTLLTSYMEMAGLSMGDPHFLFGPIIRQGGRDCIGNSKLSYNSYLKLLKSCLSLYGYNPDEYGFHSCRSGGATSLASKVTKYELLSGGRWKDARSLSHYVKLSDKRKMQFSRILTG